MHVHLTPDQEAQLSVLARTAGCGPDEFAQEVLASYLKQEARFRSAVQLGREQIACGEGISHEDVVARFEKRYGA